MRLRNIFYGIITLLMVFTFQSCANDSNDTIEKTARVQLKLVDAPGDYLAVNVEIIDIQYNSSEDGGGWKSFGTEADYPINVDLTELTAGNSLILADTIIASGMLQQIRLVLSDNNTLVIENEAGEAEEPVHLDTPSAQQSGLKLKLNETLEPGYSYTFILDWDVQKSIVKAGNSGKYNLKPVIRVNTEVNSGSVMGKVEGDLTDDEIENPLAIEGATVEIYNDPILEGDESIASTYTNANGEFKFEGLAAGNYMLEIKADGFVEYESESDIAVTIGAVNDVGTITLTITPIP
jgi:hypothetical protein